MVEHFSTDPTRPKRAQQIWLILVGLAHKRQTITYGGLAKLLKFKGAGTISSDLSPVMWLCIDQGLPPLTSIVVNQETGLPDRAYKFL